MNSFWNEELSRLLYVKEMQLLKQQAYCPRKPVRVFDQGRLLNEKLVALEHSGYIRKPMVRDLNKPTKPIFNFKKEDVNIVLYGYIRNEESSGALLHSLSGIMSSKLQSKEHQETIQQMLPPSLVINTMKFGTGQHTGIFAKQVIAEGKRFGPFRGTIKPAKVMNPACQCWEIYEANNICKIVDASDDPSHWLKFINLARYKIEQNLDVVMMENELYYQVSKDITPGQELLVWYGDSYLKFMGIPVGCQTRPLSCTGKSQITKKDAAPGSYPCKRCGKIFTYEYYRDKHLKYTRCVDMGDRKFPCHLCQRSFEKKDRLRIHILHVHQKYRPHICKICGKRFSQSSSLNKHSRVHTGERPYPCPHCPKSFTASSILRTHLRQHNGERPFKCKFCGKCFASHAAHDSHVRRTHEQLKTFICRICNKSFSMKFELQFHLTTHTSEEMTAGQFAAGQIPTSNENTTLQQLERVSVISDDSEFSLVVDI